MKRKNIVVVSAVIIAVCLMLTGCLAKTATETSETGSASVQTAVSEADEKNAVKIALKGNTAEISGDAAVYENGNILIGKGGTYSISGELTAGKITVDASDEDVILILNGAEITSTDSAAINIVKAGSVIISVKDGTQNSLTDAAVYDFDNAYSDKAEEEPNACVFSKCDLTVTGGGKLTVNGNYSNGIKSKDTLTVEKADITVNCKNSALTGNDAVKVNGSTLDLTAGSDGIHSNADVEINSGSITIKADDDGIHADSGVTVNGGTIDVTAREGIEGTTVTVNDGKISINAGDDGINAAQKTEGITPEVVINGGEINITMGAGDTDAIDANGNITINGGKINITGQSGFDYDGKAELNGGEVYLNGEKITEITNQFGAGQGGFGFAPQGGSPGFGRGGNRGFAPGNESFPEPPEAQPAQGAEAQNTAQGA
jgi:hypothetical protein